MVPLEGMSMGAHSVPETDYAVHDSNRDLFPE